MWFDDVMPQHRPAHGYDNRPKRKPLTEGQAEREKYAGLRSCMNQRIGALDRQGKK